MPILTIFEYKDTHVNLEKIKENFRFYTNIILIFSLILSLAFLYGYWSKFDINIFQFLGLFDLIRFSAYPLLILYVPVFLLFWLITELHFEFWLKNKARALTMYLNNQSTWYIKYAFFLLAAGYFAFITCLGIQLHLTALKIGVPVATIIAILWIKNLSRKTSHGEAKKTLYRYGNGLLFLCLLPFFSYDAGHYKAELILKNKSYLYAIFSKDGKNETYKFLGYLNEHYFFIKKNNESILIENKVEKLELKYFFKKRKNDNFDMKFFK